MMSSIVDMVRLIAFVIVQEDIPRSVVFEIMFETFHWVMSPCYGEGFVSVADGQAVVLSVQVVLVHSVFF